MPLENPFGALPACWCRPCARAASRSVTRHSVAAMSSITTCFVGDMSIVRPPMWIGSQCGSSYEHTQPVSRHGYSRWCESVMCGVMKSSFSAIICEKEGFDERRYEHERHERQKGRRARQGERGGYG